MLSQATITAILIASLLAVCRAQSLAWVRQTGTTAKDYANCIALDASGDVYAAGYSQSGLNGQPYVGSNDIALVKYNATGGLIWTRETGSPASDYALGIAVGEGGAVYIAGYTAGALNDQPHIGYGDIAVLKYAPNGTLLWTREVGTNAATDVGRGVAAAAGGGAIVAGYAKGPLDGQPHVGGEDFAVLKFSAEGLWEWTRMCGTTADESARGAAADASGNVYLAGYSRGSLNGQVNEGGSDIVVLKYNATGALAWTREVGTSNDDFGMGVGVDANSSAYVTGYAWGSLNGQPYAGQNDIVVVKFSAAGVLLWTRQVGSGNNDQGMGIAVDASGSNTVVGNSLGSLAGHTSAGSDDIVVIKHDAAGGLLWTIQTGSSEGDYARGVALDLGGNAAVGGGTHGSVDGQPNAGDWDIVVLKYCNDCGFGPVCECLGAYSANGVVPCAACPAGHWSSTLAATSSTTCQACTAGHWSAAGSSACVACAAGQWSTAAAATSSATCVSCPASEWSSLAGATTCQSCAAGQYTTSGSTSCASCVRGTYSTAPLTAGSLCTPCGAGRWSSDLGASGSTACQDCPAGSWSSAAAVSASALCAGCGPGRFGTVAGATTLDQCSSCAPGTWSSATTAVTACVSCSAGRYSTLVGASADTACDACLAGQYSSVVGASSETMCLGCPRGMYGSLMGLSAMSLCTACPQGTANPIMGANEASFCAPCAVGWFSNATAASACAPCAPGSSALGTGSLVCEACAPGYHASTSGQSVCELCDAGYRSPNASACLACDPGTYSVSARASVCVACAAGTYASASAATACPRCPRDEYSDTEGSARCTQCPDNTTTAHTTTPVSRGSCTCVRDMYGPAAGPCRPCPVGATCTGGIESPIAAPGYYGTWDGPETVFLACSPPEACRGGPASACETGYRGAMCAECDNRYYRLEFRCVACPDAPAWRIVLFVVVALALAIFLIWAAGSYGSYFASFSILLSYLQVLAILAELKVAWPLLLRDTFEALSILNFNTDLLATECSFAEVQYADKWVLMVLLPAVFVIVFIGAYAALEVVGCLPKKKNETVEEVEMQSVGSAPSVERRAMHVWRRVLTTREILPVDRFTFLDLLLNAFVMLLSFCYLFVVSKVTELFDCTQQGNGHSTLDASPTLDCAQEWWWNLFPLAVVMLLVYGAGFPLAFLAIRRQKRTLSRESFQQRYSLLTSRYRGEYWWWELVVLMRKLGIVLAKTFFTNYPTFQMLLATVLLVGMMLGQLQVKPFAHPLHNLLEFVLLICSYLVMFSGLLFNSVEVTSVAARTDAAGIVVFLVVVLSMVAMVGALALDVVAQVGEKREWTAARGGVVGWVMSLSGEKAGGGSEAV